MRYFLLQPYHSVLRARNTGIVGGKYDLAEKFKVIIFFKNLLEFSSKTASALSQSTWKKEKLRISGRNREKNLG
jgi:hypothetical protein